MVHFSIIHHLQSPTHPGRLASDYPEPSAHLLRARVTSLAQSSIRAYLPRHLLWATQLARNMGLHDLHLISTEGQAWLHLSATIFKCDLLRHGQNSEPSCLFKRLISFALTILMRVRERVGFNVPLDTLGHFGEDFYRPDDQTNSVKALKETSWSSKIRLAAHQNHSTMLQ